jgi:V8-like Glu-specific endopeptidase
MTKYLHDYAVGRLSKFVGDNLGESLMTPSWPGENVVSGLGCEINGYSGDRDPTGHTQYTRHGPVQMTEDWDFVIYNMSTYHGDSGAPVYYKAPNRPFWNIIGVHVTGAVADNPNNSLNFAPALSGDRLAWIMQRTA